MLDNCCEPFLYNLSLRNIYELQRNIYGFLYHFNQNTCDYCRGAGTWCGAFSESVKLTMVASISHH